MTQLLLLANGMAEIDEITKKMKITRRLLALNICDMTCLAKKIAGDGEGATAFLKLK